MERNFPGALRAPGAFGASGTSDPHAIISSCSLLVHHARLLAHSTAGDAASGRTGASGAFLRVLGRTAMLPNPASLAGDDASAARYTPQRTRASNEALK